MNDDLVGRLILGAMAVSLMWVSGINLASGFIERGLKAIAEALKATKAPERDLQHELLDLITLMPDSQTDEIAKYICELRRTRGREMPGWIRDYVPEQAVSKDSAAPLRDS